MKQERRKTLLLVEDDVIIADATSDQLCAHGYAIVMACSGDEAVETISRHPEIDLVLMDITLGRGMDGIEAARAILQMRELPIIFLTAHADQAVVDNIRHVTRYGYVLKNSGECVLRSSIDMAFELFAAHQQAIADTTRIRKLNRVYTVLSHVNQCIVRIRHIPVLLTEACRIAVEDGGFRMAWIGAVDAVTHRVSVLAHAGLSNDYIENLNIVGGDTSSDRGPAGTAIRTGAPVVCNDIEHDLRMVPWQAAALQHGYCASAAFPITVLGQVWGAFNLCAHDANFFDETEIALLDKLADDLSFALEAIEQDKRRQQAEDEIRRLNAELEERVRQRTAELEAANTELQSFAYVVSHDLKAPLRGIGHLADWLVQDYGDSFDGAGQDMVKLLIGRVKRLDDLIEGILHYSRVGRIIGPQQTIDLNRLVNDVIDTLAPPTCVRIVIERELPTIVGDTTRIFQVFQNLVGNAVKFLDKPKGTVIIGWTDEDGYWRFSIADDGPGIAPKYHARIFQMFQTLTPRDVQENTGLGLAIVKKIIEFSGGEIEVTSTPGQGSTFTFTLPKKAQNNS